MYVEEPTHARDWQTAYQSLVSAATSIAVYQIAQRHISPVIVTALTLQGIQYIVAKAKFNHIIYNDIHVW